MNSPNITKHDVFSPHIYCLPPEVHIIYCTSYKWNCLIRTIHQVIKIIISSLRITAETEDNAQCDEFKVEQ